MKKISKLKLFFFLLPKYASIAIAGLCGIIMLSITGYDVALWMKYDTVRDSNEKKEAEQKTWLSKEKNIDVRFRQILDEMIHRDKIDQPGLMNIVSDAAKRSSIKYRINNVPEVEKGKFFTFNKISISLQDVYFADILKFDSFVEKNNANICIDSIEVALGGKTLSANIGISALDIDNGTDVDKIVAKIFVTYHLEEKLIKWNNIRDNLLE
jgi:hypothetical protein